MPSANAKVNRTMPSMKDSRDKDGKFDQKLFMKHSGKAMEAIAMKETGIREFTVRAQGGKIIIMSKRVHGKGPDADVIPANDMAKVLQILFDKLGGGDWRITADGDHEDPPNAPDHDDQFSITLERNPDAGK